MILLFVCAMSLGACTNPANASKSQFFDLSMLYIICLLPLFEILRCILELQVYRRSSSCQIPFGCSIVVRIWEKLLIRDDHRMLIIEQLANTKPYTGV